MSIWRGFLCLIFPPLAVLDKGCGVALAVFILTLAGWIPGVIAAIAILIMFPDYKADQNHERLFVEIPNYEGRVIEPEKTKRNRTFVRLVDGEEAEVVDDDGLWPDEPKRKRDDFL